MPFKNWGAVLNQHEGDGARTIKSGLHGHNCGKGWRGGLVYHLPQAGDAERLR
ncbi:MAG: hypothetical protein FWG02_10260 [Holophagaceae bacterium]|nr:hypothetical protein [Holophagaceae bacterium]